MESLFIKTPEFEKTSASRVFLGQDSTTWVKEIITAFLAEYPQLQTAPLTVTWTKTKFDKGYATGRIDIPGTTITVPIIVKEFILMPMDVITKEGMFLPLNEWTAEELFTSRQPFKAVAKHPPKTELTLFTDSGSLQFSPTGENSPVSAGEGTSKVRDAVKVGSFLDRITNVNKKDVEELLTSVDSDLAASFEQNGTEEVIEKLGTVQFADAQSEYESLVRDLNLDLSFVYEDEHGNKFLKQANSRIDYTWTTPITDEELSELKFRAAPINGEMFKFSALEEKEVSKSSPTIGDCGYFKTGEEKTPQICIVNISKPADTTEKYATFKCGNGYIALNEKHDYFLNDKDEIKTAQGFEVQGTDPQIGDYGLWIVNDKATEPFEVESIYKSATPGEYEIVGNQGITKVGYYPIRSKEEDLVPLDHQYNSDFKAAYYVPGNAKFVKLASNLNKSVDFTDAYISEKLANLQDEYGILKISGFNMTSGKYNFHIVEKTENDQIVKLSEFEYDIPLTAEFISVEKHKTEESRAVVKHACGQDSAGLYYFDGPEFEKYSEEHSIRDLMKDEAIWTLLHCKGSEEDVRKLADLNKGDEHIIKTAVKAPVSVKELANTIEHAVESFEDNFMPLRRVLVKEAAVMQDAGTVDAMLSLGLINKKNLLEYVSLISNYEVILNQLAELLILVRMGVAGVSEAALVDTIESFSQVVKGLKEIEGVTTLK